MNKNTFIKIFCLIVACLLLVPMVIACGDDETPTPTSSSDAGVEQVEITFSLRSGYIVDGKDTVKITKGGKLKESQTPEVERQGYEFLGWSYTRNDPELNDAWDAAEKFNDDTTLYAQWKEKSSGNNPGGTDQSNPGGTNSSTQTPDNPGTPVVGTVTITFNTGIGYFEDNRYEVEVEKNGYFNGALPVPVSDDLSWKFNGWFKDAACTQAVSRSDKYTEDVTLYSSWSQMVSCSDGSYNHKWGQWDVDTLPTCTKAGTQAQYCEKCSAKNTIAGDPATGHTWRPWTEGFMRRERFCSKAGCDGAEYQQFKDITIASLGAKPGEQIEGNTEAFYNVPFTNLINGRWNEGFGEFIGPRGNGMAYVQFNMVEPTYIDRVYFKGQGVTSINIFVQYEGDSDFTLIGICGAAADKESSPFATVDGTKKVLAVKFVEDTPPQGTSQWQEVAFVKESTEE